MESNNNPHLPNPKRYKPVYWDSIDEMIEYLNRKYGPMDDEDVYL